MIPDMSATERAFIGCLLRSPHDVWHVNDMVTADCLAVESHRDIYTAIRDLSERGRVVTTTALQASLPEEYEGNPTIAIIMALKASAEEDGSATDYAPMLAERSALKRLQSLAKWITTQTGKNDRSADDISAEAAQHLQAITSTASPLRPKSIGEVAESVLKAANSAHQGELLSGTDTGIGPLDEILGLMLGGDLGAIIASQADGKTALATQIASHAARAGRPVLYVQMEMSQEQMAAREIAALSGVSVSAVHEGSFDAFEWDQIVAAGKTLNQMPLHILDAEEMSVRQIKAMGMAMKHKGGLSLVVIDQLDKIRAEGKHRDRFERMAEITRDLKRMAKALKVPVILLAQRTRGAQRRDDPTPDILDADAPSLERDSDWCLALWQKANWLRRNKPDQRGGEEALTKWQSELHRCQGLAEVICLKRRRGKAFQQRALTFDGATMRFSERA
jgi:replicative DNA helicase